MKKVIKVVIAIFILWMMFVFAQPFIAMSYIYINDKISRSGVDVPEIETSSMLAPEKLTMVSCLGAPGTNSFGDRANVDLAVYYEKLKAGKYDFVSLCTTPKGKFALKQYSTGMSTMVEIYLDNGQLNKIGVLESRSAEVSQDVGGNIFFLIPVISGPIIDRQIFMYDTALQKLTGIVRKGPLKVCGGMDEKQCTVWPTNSNPYSTDTEDGRQDRISSVRQILQQVKEAQSVFAKSNLEEVDSPQSFCKSGEYKKVTSQLSGVGAGERCLSNGLSYAVETFLTSNKLEDSIVLCVDSSNEMKEATSRTTSMIDLQAGKYFCTYSLPTGR